MPLLHTIFILVSCLSSSQVVRDGYSSPWEVTKLLPPKIPKEWLRLLQLWFSLPAWCGASSHLRLQNLQTSLHPIALSIYEWIISSYTLGFMSLSPNPSISDIFYSSKSFSLPTIKRKSVHTPKFELSLHTSSLSKKSFINSKDFDFSKTSIYKSLNGLPYIFFARSFYFTVKLYSAIWSLIVKVNSCGPTVYVPSSIFLRVLRRIGDII